MSILPDANSLDELIQTRKTGKEQFLGSGQSQPPTLLEFWQWSASDLVSNTTRGRLAEFIVAYALGLASGLRREWDAFDLKTKFGLKIEVKSCAYLQSWKQAKLSPITFRIPKTRAWDESENIRSEESVRQADIYVFAILAHEKKVTLNPLDLDQWHFYLIPTSILNERIGSQYSITLKLLRTMTTQTRFEDLPKAVEELEILLLKNVHR